MAVEAVLTLEELAPFRHLTTCQVADAIDALEVRLRNEGFMDGSIHCIFPNLAPMTGYAATAQIRTGAPPMSGKDYTDRGDWWNYLLTIPPPRVVVLEDLDRAPGRGSCAGEVHAHVYKALGCVGAITNGAVRDLEAVETIGFCFFSGTVAVSAAYYHMLGFGMPVDVGNLKVQPGDLLHGDRHGIISVPAAMAKGIPAAAARIAASERRVIEVADSAHPSIEALRAAVRPTVQEGRFRR